ncbi:MAG: hypothetical protein WCP28_16025 [Actinomycetes bacterium]
MESPGLMVENRSGSQKQHRGFARVIAASVAAVLVVALGLVAVAPAQGAQVVGSTSASGFGTGSDTKTKGWCNLLAKDASEGTDGQSSPYTAIVRHNRVAFLATRDTGAMPVDYMAQGAATAKVKAVNGRDDLYVNVNPNLKGSRHWDFAVQRAGPGGTWKKVALAR